MSQQNAKGDVGRLDVIALGALDQIADQHCPPVLQALYQVFRPAVKETLERDLQIPTIERLRR